MKSNPTLYPRRRNPDGSSDSICLTCFATIVNSKSEDELAEHEKAHVCISSVLTERARFSRTEDMKRIRMTFPVRFLPAA
jgi:hypothetical protein